MRLVAHNTGRAWGGNEKWLATLAAGLAARGHEVVVSCRDGVVADRLRARGLAVTAARPGTPLDAARAIGFARWLRRRRPDAVLLTSWRETLAGAWGARQARARRVVVRSGIVRAAARWHQALPFRRWVDAMIVNAPEIRTAWLDAHDWFPADAVHVVYNGIALPAFDRGDARRRLRAEWGVPAGTLVVGAAGHVTARKGFDVLLDAFARAPLGGARLVIAGDGPLAADLSARAAALGVADRARWLGWRDDVPAVLAACDVFVLSSRNEGMANVMLEAMAVGTPVIATAVSGVATAIGEEPGRPPAGWIVPPDDAEAMTRALAEVGARIGERSAVVADRVAEASRRVTERFGIDRMVDQVEAVLFG